MAISSFGLSGGGWKDATADYLWLGLKMMSLVVSIQTAPKY